METSATPQLDTTGTPTTLASRPQSAPRLLHLQILRGVAASLVVVDHSFLELNSHGYGLDRFTRPATVTGYLGVAAFFILSGLIMVRMSDGLFGSISAAKLFLWHRFVRIVPMYWLATLLWYACYWRSRSYIVHPMRQLLLSLAFIPNYLAINNHMQPVLGQGWTLNYEIAFYLLFAFCLMLPAKYAILALEAVLIIAAVAATGHRVTIGDAPGNAFAFYTSPVILLFGFGAMIAFVEKILGNSARRWYPFSPALTLCIPPLMIFFILRTMSLPHLRIWFSFVALTVVILCTVTASDSKHPVNRLLVLLGDASYSTYLFHQWPIIWLAPVAARIFRTLHGAPISPAIFIVCTILAANALGLAIHLVIERPITRAFRSIRFGPTSDPKPRLDYAAASGSGTRSPASSTS